MTSEILVGCDPEGFIMDGDTFISAHDILPGTKEEPFRIENGAVQVDGVAVEFNIDPSSDADSFDKNILSVMNQIEDMIHRVDKRLRVNWTPIAEFRKDIWDKIPEDSKVLGCDPDYNIEGQVNMNPTEKLVGSTLRTAAGHVHIGFTDVKEPMGSSHFEDCVYISKKFFHSNLPFYVPRTSEEIQRMNFYGHSGSFRAKKYGLELRSPSNTWVSTSENRRMMFSQTREKFREITGL